MGENTFPLFRHHYTSLHSQFPPNMLSNQKMYLNVTPLKKSKFGITHRLNAGPAELTCPIGLHYLQLVTQSML